MKPIPDFELGFRDAENYKRRENKEILKWVGWGLGWGRAKLISRNYSEYC